MILYKSLGVGYLLSLDLIFSPNMYHVNNPYYPDPTNGFINMVIEQIVKIFPAFALEQLILILVIFGIGYSFYRLLIRINKGQKLPSIIAATFYVWNPFVYSRIMAGQWQLLVAYAIFPLFVLMLIKYDFSKIKFKIILCIVAIWFITTLFSIHFSMLFAFAFTIILSVNIFQTKKKRELIINALKTIGIYSLLISPMLYYICTSRLTSPFTEQDILLFSSSTDFTFGIYFNLISMFGFWAENTIMISPKTINPLWYLTFIAFLIPILIYFISKLVKRKFNPTEKKVLPIAIAFILIGLTLLFTNINSNNIIWNLFYTKLPLLLPFREAQKISSIYIFGFILILNFALIELRLLIHNNKLSLFISLLILANIFCYTPTLLGLKNQITVKQYPKSYYEAKTLLDSNTTSKMLVLPWRSYDFYTYSNRQIANPAYIFFGDQVISQQNMYDTMTKLDKQYFEQNNIKFILLNKSNGYKDLAEQIQLPSIHKQFEDNASVIYTVD
jgi:hypothetical protein